MHGSGASVCGGRPPKRARAGMAREAPGVGREVRRLAQDHTGLTGAHVPDLPLFDRRKKFSCEHKRWRDRLAAALRSRGDLFPMIRRSATKSDLRGMVDEEARRLQVITRILSLTYGDPDLGNKEDPVDELAYIILSRKTRERAYKTAFNALKTRFPRWDEVLEAEPKEIKRLLFSSGLSGKKSRAIIQALRKIRDQFGSCDMSPAKSWPDEQLESFLCSLPEISRKSAYCVMMYSFGRKVFPVDTHVGRAFERLGIFRELGLELKGLDHKSKQAILADLVPPNLRYFLHVNLVVHGRTVCVPGKPRCGQCPLTKFCASYRRGSGERGTRGWAFNVADLFCGAGGLSAGLSRTRVDNFRLRTVLAIDRNPVALRTFRLNHPEIPEEGIICTDLRKVGRKELRKVLVLAKRHPIDVLVGGPPCQGFSRVGPRSRAFLRYRPEDDEQNHLYREIGRFVRLLRPKVVVMENVPGMAEVTLKDGRTFVDAACSMFRRNGYRTAVWTLNAGSYGVPQKRIRRVLVGSRLGSPPPPPPPRYGDDGEASRLEAPISLMEAIGDLPALGAGEGEWIARMPATPGPEDRYLSRYSIRDSAGLFFSHIARPQNRTDLQRFKALRPGEGYRALVGRCPWLKNYRVDTFTDKYYRLRPDRPCRALVAHLQRDGNSFVHPFQTRSLSIRELARAHSFPDSYIFTGSRWDQSEQIGNSVPPLLAEAIGETILRHLASNRQGGHRRRR